MMQAQREKFLEPSVLRRPRFLYLRGSCKTIAAILEDPARLNKNNG